MTKTPDKDRKAAERARMRAKGFKLAQFWVHPKDFDAVRAYIDRKNRGRSVSNAVHEK